MQGFTLKARELTIVWSENPEYWTWKKDPTLGYEVAELEQVWWLDIQGIMNSAKLSVQANYDIFLVYKLLSNARGVEKALSYVRLGNKTPDDEDKDTVFLDPNHQPGSDQDQGRFPTQRQDGWLEIKLGDYFNDGRLNGDIHMRLQEMDAQNRKTGLVVRAIEIRPSVFTLIARELTIELSENPEYWTWKQDPTLGYEVAELKQTTLLSLQARVDSAKLSKGTTYYVFLVYKLLNNVKEVDRALAAVRLSKEMAEGTEEEGFSVFLNPSLHGSDAVGRFPQKREDGWLEMKLDHYFNNNDGSNGEIFMHLLDKNTRTMKTGIVVRAIEFRAVA